jgi:carotenoid cleavage dioxygenase-like enzyme
VQLGAFAFFHDMAVTEHYYVLLQNPTKLNLLKVILEYIPGEYRGMAFVRLSADEGWQWKGVVLLH